MTIRFDPKKNRQNQAKHGLAFEQVAECDWDKVRYEVQHGDFAEDRFKAVLPLGGVAHVVVFTYREGAMRIISFRRANRKERMRYG